MFQLDDNIAEYPFTVKLLKELNGLILPNSELLEMVKVYDQMSDKGVVNVIHIRGCVFAIFGNPNDSNIGCSVIKLNKCEILNTNFIQMVGNPDYIARNIEDLCHYIKAIIEIDRI